MAKQNPELANQQATKENKGGQKSLTDALQNETLRKSGAFKILSTTAEGLGNLDPSKKATRNVFLTDKAFSTDRKALLQRLKMISKIVENSEDIASMVETAKDTAQNSETLLKKNVGNALEQTKSMEEAYRTLSTFYENAGQEKLKNVSIMNVTQEQLQDLDTPMFFDTVQTEIKRNFDRLDLKDNYSLLVLPGYLGSNAILNKWSKLAYDNKVMMVTDFRDLDTPDTVMTMFDNAQHTGSDIHLSCALMACNYLVARKKYEEFGEEEPLYIPPSTALAGRIYDGLMSQVVAGRRHGVLNGVHGVKFELMASEIAELDKLGVIPMVDEFGRQMAFSGKTLFNGDNLGLQTYSVVRVFDWVAKNLMDFLNRNVFTNWNVRTRNELYNQIMKFLNNITGPGKMIEDFTIKKFDQDPNDKTKIILDIHMTPFFPAKNFVISLTGYEGEDANWEAGDIKEA